MTQFQGPTHPPENPVPADQLLQLEPKRSSWPTVIAVICIVFGSLGAMNHTCNGNITKPMMAPGTLFSGLPL